jgi:hypothetical protein
MPACGSPKLIAACHVLHRLLLPRHPPCALSSLTTKFTQHMAAFCIARNVHRFEIHSKVLRLLKIFVIPSEARNLLSFRPAQTSATLRRFNFMGLYPAHRTPQTLQLHPTLSFRAEHDFREAKIMRSRGTCFCVHQQALSGTHKNYVRLVNCPIYSVVKYRPRQPTVVIPSGASISRGGIDAQSRDLLFVDLPASAGMGLTHFRRNNSRPFARLLKFLQPNVRCQATFV